MAEEEAEDGEGAEKDDKDIGDKGDDAGIPVSAMVVHQTPAYHHYQRLSYSSTTSSCFPRSTIFTTPTGLRLRHSLLSLSLYAR